MKDDSHRIALFIDFDNIETGVRISLGQQFKISVLLEALKEKGVIISKRAYGDWQRFGSFTREFGEHGVEMIQRVTNYRGDKNGADINIVVDAMELALTNEHIDAFGIVSGDSDFLPLITRLKLHNKFVYVIGGLAFTSASIQKNCTEFIAYENLIRTPETGSGASRRKTKSRPLADAIPTLHRAIAILEERGVTPTSGAVKSCMLQLDPTFDERTYGISTFSTFLRMVEKNGLIRLGLPSSGGGFLVSLASAAGSNGPEETRKKEHTEALELLTKALEQISESGSRRYVPVSWFRKKIKEIDPKFDERHYGFERFSSFLKFGREKGLLNIARGKGEAMVARAAKPGQTIPAAESDAQLQTLGPELREAETLGDPMMAYEQKHADEADASQTLLGAPPNQALPFENTTDKEQETRDIHPPTRKREASGPRSSRSRPRTKSRSKS